MGDFIVVKSGRCLLGHITVTKLGILHVGSAPVVNNTVDNTSVEQLQARYPSPVFQGIGKLKDYQFKLHIDTSVTPVVQKMQR